MSVPVAEDRLYHLWTARAALSVDLARIIDGRAICTLGSIFSTRRAEHGCARRCQRSSGPARQIGVMQDSAPSTASELGVVRGRWGKEADPHGVSSILWTHLVREPRRKTIRAEKKESDGGLLERSEALARRKVSILQGQADTDLHASLCTKAVTDTCVTELSGVANERKIHEKLRGGVQAVGTIRLGVRMDIMAARTSGDRYNT
jgi:hypothetical protein